MDATVIDAVVVNETVHRSLRDRVNMKTVKTVGLGILALAGAYALYSNIKDKNETVEDTDFDQ